MSGQLVGGAIGAAIGFYVGGPAGAQAGWAVGAVVGGVIDPERIDGPRLQDRKVQVSSYGASIPIVYGGDAVAGNVIWSTDLVEHDVQTGGKGGPVVTNHTYTVSCAVLICEGPITSLRRIWADAKLIYDTSDTADDATQAASGALANYFVFYQGGEDQLPDPTIEADLGAGNVPAYRGSCYIVFTDLPLTDFGNRIPNFRFEVSTEPSIVDGGTEIVPLQIGDWADTALGPRHAGRHEFEWNGAFFSTEAEAIAAMLVDEPLATVYLGYYTSTSPWLSAFGHSGGSQDTLNDGFGARYVYLAFNVEEPDEVIDTGLVDGAISLCTNLNLYGADPMDGLVRMYSSTGVYPGGDAGHQGLMRFNPGPDPSPEPGYSPATQTNNCTNYPSSGGHFPVATISGHRFIRVERLPSLLQTQACEPGTPVDGAPAQVPGNADFCIAVNGDITPNYQYSEVAGSWLQLKATSPTASTYQAVPIGPTMLASDPRNTQAFWEAEAAAAGVTGSYGTNFPEAVTEAGESTWTSTEVGAGDIDLAQIVADICARAGMPANSPDASYDVSALMGIPVQGFCIARQMPARAALLQLQQTFWWDFVESGRVVKAVLRGAASLATLPASDLGAVESGEPGIAVVPVRGQEAELPATISVSYPARDTGYEVSTQRARRVVTGSRQIVSLELAVVMTDQRASDTADVILYSAWMNRTQREWKTTREYAKLEPTDVVTVQDDEFSYVVRITERHEAGGLIQWRGVDELPAAYDPNTVPAIASGNGIGGVRFDGPMQLELIDCPILIDEDDNAGIYAAASGYRDTWRGGTAFRSIDAGVSYQAQADMAQSATLGSAQTVLGTFAGGNSVDEANTVTVTVRNGTLSTITRAALLNAGNAAILGDELIQFQRADLVSAGVYRLSGLLRGRRGTEQHMASHAVGERFVVLTEASIYRIVTSLAEIGIEASWKGVSAGGAIDAVTEQAFTNTGAGLKPLAPAHLHAIDIGGGEYRVSWVRRSRIGGKWRDEADVPLGEAAESYNVLVISAGATVSNTTTSASPLDVTAAPGDIVQVYQMSALVGRGFAAQITLT